MVIKMEMRLSLLMKLKLNNNLFFVDLLIRHIKDVYRSIRNYFLYGNTIDQSTEITNIDPTTANDIGEET